MRLLIIAILIFISANAVIADSTMTTYRGILEKSHYTGMVKLRNLFQPDFTDYASLVERTGNYSIGDTVIISGYIKETRRDYSYPVLHVQSIDKFIKSDSDSDPNMVKVSGVLRESQINNMTIISSHYMGPSYYIERTGNFELGDNVVIKGYIKETRIEYNLPLLHVQSIDEYNCCLNNIRGDVNLDGKVNLADVIMLNSFFKNHGWTPQICFDYRDINGDELIDEEDAQFLYDYVMHCGPEPVDCE